MLEIQGLILPVKLIATETQGTGFVTFNDPVGEGEKLSTVTHACLHPRLELKLTRVVKLFVSSHDDELQSDFRYFNPRQPPKNQHNYCLRFTLSHVQ